MRRNATPSLADSATSMPSRNSTWHGAGRQRRPKGQRSPAPNTHHVAHPDRRGRRAAAWKSTPGRRRDGIDGRVEMPLARRVEQPAGIARRIAGQRSIEQDPNGKRREARLVGRKRRSDKPRGIPSTPLFAASAPGRRGHRDRPAPTSVRRAATSIPARERRRGTIEERRQGRARAKQRVEGDARHARARTRRAIRCRGSATRGRQPVRSSLSRRARPWPNRGARRPACRRAAARLPRPPPLPRRADTARPACRARCTWPPFVLISTASMQSTPWRYAGGSGWRVASPWSVITTNCSPARAAAAAIASRSPVPSDRVLCT